MTMLRVMPDLQLSLIVSCTLALQILTFPEFLFLDPFSNSLGVFLAGAQLAAVTGWIVLLFVPPILIALRTRIGRRFSIYLAISASIWPAVLLSIRLVHLAVTGNPGIDYHLSYPIFVLSDFVVPILYWSIARHASALYRQALNRQRQARQP
jgi:hypothetical protein